MVPASDAADEQALAILDQVQLESLSATPGTIAPFAASKIAWNVSGPGGFSVRLDSAQVPRIGEKLVTPLSSRTFKLIASAGRFKQTLGAVTVTVDQAACKIIPVPNHFVQQQVQQSLDELLAEMNLAEITLTGMKKTTRRRPDVVTVDATGIGIDLAWKQEVANFPNADADVDAHWHYRVSNGQLEAQFDALSVSVSFPWWTWLIPIVYPGLPIAISMAEDSQRSKVRNKAAGGGDGLELFVEPGFRLLSAQFNQTNFEMLACPDKTLHQLIFPGAPILGAIQPRGRP